MYSYITPLLSDGVTEANKREKLGNSEDCDPAGRCPLPWPGTNLTVDGWNVGLENTLRIKKEKEKK